MKLVLPIALLALLSGCALSPQTVTIDPTLTTAATPVAAGLPVDLRVVDARPREDLGTRGGVYRESSRIVAGNDIADAVRTRAIEGLAARGYRTGEATTDLRLRLAIDQLTYEVSPGAVATGADITAALGVAIERGDGQRLETSYRSTVTRKFPVPPSATQNAAWINEVLGETLERFLQDARIHDFLQAK